MIKLFLKMSNIIQYYILNYLRLSYVKLWFLQNNILHNINSTIKNSKKLKHRSMGAYVLNISFQRKFIN